MFSGFVFILCILHSLGDEATKSCTENNEKNINLDLTYKSHEIEIDRDKIQQVTGKESQSFNHKDAADIQRSESSPQYLENVAEYEIHKEIKNEEDLVFNKSTESKIADLSSWPNTLKSEKLSFVEIIKNFMVKNLQSPAISAVNEANTSNGDVNNKETEDSHSGSGISYDSSHDNSTDFAQNVTSSNDTKSPNGSHTKKATCLQLDKAEMVEDVKIVNATTLLKLLQSNANITSRSTPAECYLIYFFSPYCPFSTQGSAYVNALARSVPNIPVYGVNSVEYHSLNARYGIMGTPSLVLFHNGHTVGRYNASEYSTFYLESFIHHFTNQEVNSINVTSQDFKANLPSNTQKSCNLALYIAWAFLLICAGYVFLNSEFYAKLTEAVLNNWREAEAQHEHNE